MAVRNRGGFTLVELLVVITIIGMLVALLVPAVIGARNAARRAQCINNQSELSKAVLQFEMAKQHFPGYVNNFGQNPTPLSWTVVCLPYLGREDLWKQWRDNPASGLGKVHLDQFICPSDLPPEPHATSYVANCGRHGIDPSPARAFGVFHDHTVPPQARTLVSASNLPDGTQTTVLIAENVQANQWYFTAETDIGTLWLDSPGNCGLINLCVDQASTTGNPELARPSSFHAGGAVVSFCDGRVVFQNENIEYAVYQHLMTPDGVNAGLGPTP